MNEDEYYRQRLRNMFTDFYKDVAHAGYFEKEKEISLKEFNDFIQKWVDKHFPFPLHDEIKF